MEPSRIGDSISPEHWPAPAEGDPDEGQLWKRRPPTMNGWYWACTTHGHPEIVGVVDREDGRVVMTLTDWYFVSSRLGWLWCHERLSAPRPLPGA